MGKIYSIHMLALKQDVTEEAFERFVREEWNPNFVPPQDSQAICSKG